MTLPFEVLPVIMHLLFTVSSVSVLALPVDKTVRQGDKNSVAKVAIVADLATPARFRRVSK